MKLLIPNLYTPEQTRQLFEQQRERDPIGLKIHLVCAIIACFLAAWPTSFVEWAMLPPLIATMIRMTTHHRVLRPLWGMPILWWIMAWCAWTWLSLLWSPATDARAPKSAWLQDVQTMRFAGLIVGLWPVMMYRKTLITALIAGTLAGELSQAVQLVGLWSGHVMPALSRMPGRVSGWWDPVVGGSVLCGMLGVQLGVVFRSTHKRALCLTGVGITVVCILLTGTRGAWIGGAGLIALVGLIWVVQTRGSRIGWATILSGTIVLAGVIGALTLNVAQVQDRARSGIHEVQRALTSKDYTSDTGMRVGMWIWATRAWREHPITGIGASGYKVWAEQERARMDASESLPPLPHAHAHSWYMHTLATLGTIGGILLAGLLGTCVLTGIRFPASLPGAMGIAGLACAGAFDTISVNQQPMYLLCVLFALTLPLPIDIQKGGTP